MARPWFVFLFTLIFVVVLLGDVTSQKGKKPKPKKRRVADIVKDMEQNISSLWHEVEMLQQPVHVHIHSDGGDLEHEHLHDDHMDHYHHDHHDHHDHHHHDHGGEEDEDMDKMAMGDQPLDKKGKKKMKKPKKGDKLGDGLMDKMGHDHEHTGHGHDHDHDHHRGHDHEHDHGPHEGHDHDHDHDHHHDHGSHKGHDHDHHRGHGHHRYHGDHDHMGHGFDDDFHHGHGHGAHIHIHLHTGEEREEEHTFLDDLPPEEYVHARCDVVPSLALEESEQHKELKGSIYFRQKPKEPLQVAVDLSGFNMDHARHAGQMHEHLHGMHGHVFGDVSDNCANQGGHYNPHQIPHGGQDAAVSRHPGDFGNLKVEDDGTAAVMFNDTVAALFGPHSLLGRGIVIHAGADDLGLAGTEASRKSGNAGARIACCAVVATPPHKGVWPDE